MSTCSVARSHLKNNTASNNNYGFSLDYAVSTELIDNKATYNTNLGVYIKNVRTAGGDTWMVDGHNILSHNTISNNDIGIYLISRNETLFENNISNNTHNGIYLNNWICGQGFPYQVCHYDNGSNNIIHNELSNNGNSIYVYSSWNNNLKDNSIMNNNNGIILINSKSNLIYNNYFNNINDAIDSGNNIWKTIKTPGTNIVGGSWLGGNYWSNYAGKDTDGDGLGDTLLPYNSNGNIITGGDYLPLVNPSTSDPSISFTDPTPANGATLSQNYALLNTTISHYSTAFIDWNHSLIGWWRFNNENGENPLLFRDWSTRGNNGTCSGVNCPSFTSGRLGNALNFDGINDYVDAGSGESLNITDAITIEAWINPALTEPVLKGSYFIGWELRGVAVAGNYAYVADDSNGLVIVDVTNPAAPALKGSYDTLGNSQGVAVAGNYVYVADTDNGLVIVDITNPAAPTLKGSYDTVGSSNGVAVAGNYAYVADGSNGLVIVDVTNPAAPTLKGSYNTAGSSKGVAVAGNYAYVADGSKGLVIVDVTNPAAPTLKGSYDTAWFSEGVAVAGNYAYVADSYSLVIVDITNPAAPTLKGSYGTAGNHGVVVEGNYAYVADTDNGLVIVDVTNPAAPALKGSYDTTGYSWAVAVVGKYAYVADGFDLVIVDVNPAVAQEKCWDGVSGNNGIIGKVSAPANSVNYSWALRYGAPGGGCYLGFDFNGNPEGSRWVTVNQALTPGEWYHIVGTFNGTDINSYLNGDLKDSNKISAIKGYRNKLLIGNDGWSNLFNGKIDEVRIHRRALSPEEIKASYFAGIYKLYRNFTGLASGSYNYQAYAQNLAGAVNQTEKRTLNLIASTGLSLPEALDNTSLIITTGGNTNWTGQTAISYFGGDAAQSGIIPDYGNSWMQTTISGPGTASFYWKVSSEEEYDFLEFYLDGTLQTQISGIVDWHKKSYVLSAGTHTLRWRYVKDRGVSAGSDAGWVDKFEFVPGSTPPGISLPEAVDNTSLTITTGGNANWTGQTVTYYFGGDAAQSGIIPDNGNTWMQTTVSGPGTASFYWKVSSEEEYDFLEFYLDGTLQTQISGIVDWHKKSYALTAGSHTLRWRYVKDRGVSAGSDAGWVDKVVFVPT